MDGGDWLEADDPASVLVGRVAEKATRKLTNIRPNIEDEIDAEPC